MYGRCIDHMRQKSACKTRGHETPWTHIGSADVRIQFGRNGRRRDYYRRNRRELTSIIRSERCRMKGRT